MMNKQGIHINLMWNCKSLCGKCFSLFGVRMLWFAHRYNKLLLLYKSKNGDIAWWNKNNSSGLYPFSLKKDDLKKKLKKSRWLFFKKPGFFLTLSTHTATLHLLLAHNHRRFINVFYVFDLTFVFLYYCFISVLCCHILLTDSCATFEIIFLCRYSM